MSRAAETSIPIVLWLCAAAVVHAMVREGATKAADYGFEQLDLRQFVQQARWAAAGVAGNAEPMEVSFTATQDDEELKLEEPDKPQEKPKDKDKPKTEKKPDEEKKPEEKKVVEKKKITLPTMQATPPPPPPPPQQDRRIAVKQHVDDPNQPDNPTAQLIADDANHVKEETRATITNHERDDKSPTPGRDKSGALTQPGNSEKTKVADAENQPGESKHLPGEKSAIPDSEHKVVGKAQPASAAQPAAALPPSAQEGKNGVSGPKVPMPAPAPAPVKETPPATPPGVPDRAPEASTTPDGEYTLDPRKETKDSPRPGPSNSSAPPAAPSVAPKPYAIPGLGGGAGPSGININLSPGGALAVIGEDALKKSRDLDGERRKSEHRGSWQANGLERWKAAIENYVPTVKPGNQTALNTARVPFASYLNGIHNRLHPIFAEEFLSALDGLSNNHAWNDKHLVAVLEVSLDGDGRIVRMGVTKTSGVTSFDIAALNSMQRASQGGFGKPPAAIFSTDGRVYLHWEFHRDPVDACSTRGARPYMLNLAPPTSPVVPPPGPSNPKVRETGSTKGTEAPKRDGDKG